MRPRRIFGDPFSSPIPSWGDVPEADDEAVLMALWRQRRSQLSEDYDGPCSEIHEEELIEIRRKYSIPPSVELTCPTEFELVSCLVSFAGEALVRLAMEVPRRFRWVTFSEALRHSRVWGETIFSSFLLFDPLSELLLLVCFFSRNVLRLSISSVYDEYHKAKTWRRHPLSPPISRAGYAMFPAGGSSFFPTTVSTGSCNGGLIGPRQCLRTRAPARWELMKEWLEKNVGHWNPEEEYHRYLLVVGVLNLSGDLEILVFGRVPPSLDRLLPNASWIDVVGRVKPEGNP
uniref:Uncharacterized protein n=1 Tax=Brassica campestris TaxID=3711 RepID=M4F1L5_BRACM